MKFYAVFVTVLNLCLVMQNYNLILAARPEFGESGQNMVYFQE